MNSLSSHCRNCGKSVTVAEFDKPWCNECEDTTQKAIATAKAADPNISPSDALYAGRVARTQRAVHPRQTFINPRSHNRMGERS